MDQGRIHYGTLESSFTGNESLTKRQDSNKNNSNMVSFSSLDSIMESRESQQNREDLEKTIQDMQVSSTIFVPTDIDEVKFLLRKFGEPITYFGERPEERSARLKKILMQYKESRGIEGISVFDSLRREGIVEEEEKIETIRKLKPKGKFYTKGKQILKERRLYILKYSLKKSKKRISKHFKIQANLTEPETKLAVSQAETVQKYLKNSILKQRKFVSDMKEIDLVSSQIGDLRPVSSISLSPDGQKVVTGSWSGIIKVWSIADLRKCQKLKSLKGHSERVSSVCFNPMYKNEKNSFAFASSGADKKVKLWSAEKKRPLHTFEGHSFYRMGRIGIHPSGRFVGSTSFDGVWHLYDVTKQKILYEQEGHSSEVYSIAFHGDGSLCATCDFGGIVRVWDLRNGSSVCALIGHCRKVMCVDFSPNGYILASAGDDNTVRMWNLRKQKAEYVLPAHVKLISDVKFEKENGRYFVTSSYDRTIRIWKSVEYSVLNTLKGHENLVMNLDVSNARGNEFDPLIVSCSYDKSWKVWKRNISNKIV